MSDWGEPLMQQIDEDRIVIYADGSSPGTRTFEIARANNCRSRVWSDPLPRLDGEFGFALRDQFGAAGLHLTFGLIDDIHRLE